MLKDAEEENLASSSAEQCCWGYSRYSTQGIFYLFHPVSTISSILQWSGSSRGYMALFNVIHSQPCRALKVDPETNELESAFAEALAACFAQRLEAVTRDNMSGRLTRND